MAFFSTAQSSVKSKKNELWCITVPGVYGSNEGRPQYLDYHEGANDCGYHCLKALGLNSTSANVAHGMAMAS